MPQLENAAGVRTAYTDQGHGDPVVLLHGGVIGGDTWQPAVDALVDRHRVLVPERRGHGRTPDVPGDYTYPAMAEETIAFLDRVVGGPADLVGYSDGGIVALHVAIDRPDLVRRVVVIGTNFHVDGLVPGLIDGWSDADPDDEGFAEMRQAHEAVSPDGTGAFAVMVHKVLRMAATGPTLTVEDLEGIQAPVLVVAGDDDLCDPHHTVDLYLAVPRGRLAIVPGTTHMLPDERPDVLLSLIDEFLHGDLPDRTVGMRAARSR